MVRLKDAKSIIQYEYGKNISVFMIADGSEEIADHEEFFLSNCTKITFSSSYSEATKYLETHDTKFDLIIINISDKQEDAEKLLKYIRQKEELIYILAFTVNKRVHDYIAQSCYCTDGIMPYPFDDDYTFRYLYRFFKRITMQKELEAYVSILEGMLNTEEKIEKKELYEGEERRNRDGGSIEDREVKDDKNLKNDKIRIEDNKLKNIRFNQSHKITAIDFMDSLDPSIVDKIEGFEEKLDNYAMLLYDIENLDATESMQKIIEVNEILEIFADTVTNITAFPIIAETFTELTRFLTDLEAISFEDLVQKKLLVEVLLGLGNDLELWIKAIFIDQSTDDIHYFDASFANNCLEIEALFHQNEFEEDDGDLEFF